MYAACFIILLSACLPFCARRNVLESETDNNTPPVYPEPREERAWLLMYYDAADDLIGDTIYWFSEHARSHENLWVVIMQDDKALDGSKKWHVGEDHDLVLLDRPGELNTGDPETLTGFIRWAKHQFPAERSIISFYSHGLNWKGACTDSTDGYDRLTMSEMRDGIKHAGNVDFVFFSAPCNMAGVEVAFELRGCTQYFIGSEEVSAYILWKEAMGEICERILSEPDISNRDLAEYTIRRIDAHTQDEHEYGPYWRPKYTMSAVDLSQIENVGIAVKNTVEAYLNDREHFKTLVDSVYNRIPLFHYRYVDLGNLVKSLLEIEQESSRREGLRLILATLNDAVVDECHGTNWDYLCGLTIYFPKYAYDSRYNTGIDRLEFCQLTGWEEMLRWYFNQDQDSPFVYP